MGGSQGSALLNQVVRSNLDVFLKKYRIIHITGIGKNDITMEVSGAYFQKEFIHNELADILAASDLVVCRAGANTIFELLALAKPMVLIPLQQGSRGDQLFNAKSFERQGWALNSRIEESKI